MKVVHHKQFVPANFVHRDEILDGLVKCAKRLVMVKVADVLADKRLAVDDQRDGIFQVGAERENGALGRK